MFTGVEMVRKLKRDKKKKVFFAGNSRSEKIYNALKVGRCVDCGCELIFKGRTFSCSSCGWEGEYSFKLP